MPRLLPGSAVKKFHLKYQEREGGPWVREAGAQDRGGGSEVSRRSSFLVDEGTGKGFAAAAAAAVKEEEEGRVYETLTEKAVTLPSITSVPSQQPRIPPDTHPTPSSWLLRCKSFPCGRH